MSCESLAEGWPPGRSSSRPITFLALSKAVDGARHPSGASMSCCTLYRDLLSRSPRRVPQWVQIDSSPCWSPMC